MYNQLVSPNKFIF